jgi:hypothetical protein
LEQEKTPDKIQKTMLESKMYSTIKVDISIFEEALKITKEKLKMFAEVTFSPQENITAYELARIVKMFTQCSVSLGKLSPIKIYTLEDYNEFITKFNDVLDHLDVVVYGNAKSDQNES